MKKTIQILVLCLLTQTVIHADQKMVTIWVHGTMLPARPILPAFAVQSFFHKKLGFTPIGEYKKSDQLHKLANTLCEVCPESYDIDHYYTFGWSGELNFEKREQAAQELYQEIINLVNEYRSAYKEQPHLRIITHSHGGNVVLNLANIINDSDQVSIDELIVLACPVQEKTKSLVTAPCFKKVYAFYSSGDIIQIIDPQGLHKNNNAKSLFSGRKFDNHDNLYQAQVKFNGRSLMHVEFLGRPFCCHLAQLCKEIEEFHTIKISSETEQPNRVLDIYTNTHGSKIHKKIALV